MLIIVARSFFIVNIFFIGFVMGSDQETISSNESLEEANIIDTKKIHKSRTFHHIKSVGTVDAFKLNIRSNANITGTLNTKNIIVNNNFIDSCNIVYKNGDGQDFAIATFKDSSKIQQSCQNPAIIDSNNNLKNINDICFDGDLKYQGQSLIFCDNLNNNLGFGYNGLSNQNKKKNRANSTYGNLSLGTNNMISNQQGSCNTVLGQSSLSNNNGNHNTAIGFQAGNKLMNNESNNILINNLGTIDQNNSIAIGNETHTQCSIAGINLADVGEDSVLVFINSMGQLGVSNGIKSYKNSSKRISKNISKKIENLKPVEISNKNGQSVYKLLIEDIENNNLEELLIKNNLNESIGIKYDSLIILLLNEIQNLGEKIKKLEEKIYQ